MAQQDLDERKLVKPPYFDTTPDSTSGTGYGCMTPGKHINDVPVAGDGWHLKLSAKKVRRCSRYDVNPVIVQCHECGAQWKVVQYKAGNKYQCECGGFSI